MYMLRAELGCGRCWVQLRGSAEHGTSAPQVPFWQRLQHTAPLDSEGTSSWQKPALYLLKPDAVSELAKGRERRKRGTDAIRVPLQDLPECQEAASRDVSSLSVSRPAGLGGEGSTANVVDSHVSSDLLQSSSNHRHQDRVHAAARVKLLGPLLKVFLVIGSQLR